MSSPSQTFEIGEADRYDSLRLIPWWDQQRLAAAKILVVGAGAIGNETIKNLCLLGVGNIAIVDMDTIESSNLSRSILFRQSDTGAMKAEVAARFAKEINPKVNVIPLTSNVIHAVGLGWFADADCVLGCLDNREARLWLNRCCWHVGTPWIDAGIQEISGVVQVFQPPDGTCYECGMKEADYQLINVRYSCPLLQAEDVSKGRVPTSPTIASVVAGWQVQEAIKLIHGLPTAESSAMVFHGMTNSVYQTKLPKRDECLSHDPWDEPILLPAVTAQTTLQELWPAVFEATAKHPTALILKRDLVTKLTCTTCETFRSMCQLRGTTFISEAFCEACEQTMLPEFVSRIQFDDETYTAHTLSEIGIPASDILTLEFDDGIRPFRIGEPTFLPASNRTSNDRP